MAKTTLVDASRDVQSYGWHFNTDKALELPPDQDGFINLPANCLRVDTVRQSQQIDVVQRGSRLYKRREQSFVFDAGVTVDLVSMLDWEELPQDVRRYITIVACRRFQERTAASQVIEQFTQRDERDAMLALQSSDAENADYNIITDNYPNIRTVSRIY